MIAPLCKHESCKKHGKTKQGAQRLRCLNCGKTFLEDTPKPLGDMRISMKQATLALGMLLEGMSVRSVERITGLHRDTICDLVLTVGENCERFLQTAIRNVPVEDVQCDEIWSFVGCKEKNRLGSGRGEDFGDSWTFIAIERNTKMVLAYQIGNRDQYHTQKFLQKLDNATSGQFQLSTDGLNTYTNSVPFTFGERVDYGQLVKNYQSSQQVTRYSPAKIISSEKKAVFGNPNEDQICTSHIESFNQKFRMAVRRFTRLTNSHSKSLKHHEAMQAIYFAYYNFCRKHDTLGQTPAMAAGVTAHALSLQGLLESAGN